MYTKRSRAETDSTSIEGRAPRRQARHFAPTELHPLVLSAADSQVLQTGIAQVRQQIQRSTLAEACRDIAKSPAIEMQLSSLCAAGNRIEQQIAADRQRLQEAAVGSTALRTMNPLLEAERERWKRLAEIAHPQRGLLESIRMQTSALDQIVEASTATLRGIAEACSPRLPSLDIGFGLDAISALGAIGDLGALDDQHSSMRIHAVPRWTPPRVACPGRCHDHASDRAPLPAHPEAAEHGPGWLDGCLDDEGGRRVLELLSRFVRSEEIPSDAREGMSVLIAWWKLNRLRITPDQSLELNRIVHGFIGDQLGLTTASDHHKQLKSGLLVPLSESRQKLPAVELDPRIYTSLELSKIFNYHDSTIRRQADTAWTKAGGLGPCPLRRGSNWYVVDAPEDGGGQKRGWKFQQLSERQEG
jgi:hypothetical protein